MTLPSMTLPLHVRKIMALAALSLSACGEDGTTVNAPGEVSRPAADAAAGPLFLIQTRTFSPEGTTGLLIPTPSLDEPIDESRAIEQSGGGVLYAAPGIGAFLIGSGEEPTITRYEIAANGAISPGASLSFANEGVVYLYAGSVTFVSPTQAYYFDLDQLQAIAFDPTAMAITGRVSLAGAEREGFFTSFGVPVLRPDGIYFTGQWYREPDWDRVPEGSLLVHLDTETNEVTMTPDARCTSMLSSLTTASGDTYWFSDMFNAFARLTRGPGNGFPDCALVLRAGQSQFDPDWQLDTGARTGGSPSVAILKGGDTEMWFRVLDPALAGLAATSSYDEYDTAPAWQWYLLDVTSDAPAVRSDRRPPSSMGALGMYVDGRSFTTIENADYSQTTLLELTERDFVERLTVRGVIDEVVRVR
jgi:hypothetical protein